MCIKRVGVGVFWVYRLDSRFSVFCPDAERNDTDQLACVIFHPVFVDITFFNVSSCNFDPFLQSLDHFFFKILQPRLYAFITADFYSPNQLYFFILRRSDTPDRVLVFHAQISNSFE